MRHLIVAHSENNVVRVHARDGGRVLVEAGAPCLPYNEISRPPSGAQWHLVWGAMVIVNEYRHAQREGKRRGACVLGAWWAALLTALPWPLLGGPPIVAELTGMLSEASKVKVNQSI